MMGSMATMNMASMQVTGSTGGGPGVGGNQPSIVNFQTSMQTMQGVQQQQSMVGQSGPGHVTLGPGNVGMHHQDMMTQMGQNVGPQTVNNTYVNATMSIQQLNIQNVTTSAYNPALQVQPLNPHTAIMNQMSSGTGSGVVGSSGSGQGPGMGANTVSSSVTTNPIVHSSVSPKSAMQLTTVSSPQVQSGPRLSGPHLFPHAAMSSVQQQQQQHQQQRLIGPSGGSVMTGVGSSGGPVVSQGHGMGNRGPGPVSGPSSSIPYNGANVQVKASAPNTIQYLPTRPQNPANAPQRPPSLEFLQRFTGPLSGMDGKVPAGHGLQYFSHSGQGQGQGMGMGMGLNMQGLGPQMNSAAVAPGMNSPMGGGGSGNTNVGMMGSGMGPGAGQAPQGTCMPRGPNPAMMRPGGPQQMMGGQMYGMFPGGPGESAMYAGMSSPMMGGPGGASSGMSAMGPGVPPGANPMGSGMPGVSSGPSQMYGGGGGVPKGQMPPMGMGVDSTQPLPPTMGQSAGFKQSPYLGPTTADPNYAQQFHNFQQQLYATNTRGGQMSAQDRMAAAAGQTFFSTK